VAGKADVAGAVQVAQLALKHRRNKNGGQRVVVFIGSPIDADAKALVKVRKQANQSKASKQASSAVFFRSCFVVLLAWIRRTNTS